jgi:hypothetical protein
MTEPEKTIKVKLQVTAVTRKTCLVCGCETSKDPVQAFVYEDGERTHHVVCESCLQLPPSQLIERLREAEHGFRAHADLLDIIATNLPPMPTHEQWRQANLDHELQYLADEQQEQQSEQEKLQKDAARRDRLMALIATVGVGAITREETGYGYGDFMQERVLKLLRSHEQVDLADRLQAASNSSEEALRALTEAIDETPLEEVDVEVVKLLVRDRIEKLQALDSVRAEVDAFFMGLSEGRR